MSTQIREEFAVHLLNDQGKDKALRIAEIFSSALNQLEEICGKQGREMAIVRTHLQDAGFYAKRAMAIRPENQQAANADPIGFGSVAASPDVGAPSIVVGGDGEYFVKIGAGLWRIEADGQIGTEDARSGFIELLSGMVKRNQERSADPIGFGSQSVSSGAASSDPSQPTPPPTWGGK